MSKGHERIVRMLFYVGFVVYLCFYTTWNMLWYLFAPDHGDVSIQGLIFMAHFPLLVLALMFLWKRDVMRKDRAERKDGYAGYVKLVSKDADNREVTHPQESK